MVDKTCYNIWLIYDPLGFYTQVIVILLPRDTRREFWK